jgi:parallel beta-helix repeat protein
VSNGGFSFNTDAATTPAATTISDDEFVQATAAPETGTNDSGQAVMIAQGNGNNVAISQNSFTNLSGPGAAITTTGAGSAGSCPASSSGLSISNNAFTDDGSSGSGDGFLDVVCTAGALVTENTASITASADSFAKTPVVLGGGDTSPTVSGNTLNGDAAPSASGVAVTTAAYPGDNATISGNRVTGFAQDGIGVSAGGSNPAPDSFSVTDNTVTGSGDGIAVVAGTNGSVTDNDAVDSATSAGRAHRPACVAPRPRR